MTETQNVDGGAAECSLDAASGTGIPQPVVITRGEHGISRRDIDPDALKVLYRLARNNFIAYLVGGGVRDLLLGRKPKDFDVSTNARPEQIRALFRNCLLIGRRFRLAHVRYGEKIIETSTFRCTPKCPADPADPDADLFQRDDNMFGSPAEDAFRRDFTVNGLFYDIETFSIIDYVGGMKDLDERRIRCIGDPNIRFREDPVRMVRAVRFASRLNFTLDPDTEEAIRRHGEELTKASPARLLEEITRLFAFSSGERAVRLLASTGLLRVILPEVSAFLDSDKYDHDIFWSRLRALDNGDTVLPEGSPALIFAVLFFDAFKASLQRDWAFDTTPKLRFDKAHDFLDPLSVRLRFPRKLVDRIVHMYINQSRFSSPADRGKKGSLTNFVTQESFHESLALAEIVLTSENGGQTRLNHWRELLVERIFGHEDGGPERQHSDRDHRGRHGRQDRNGSGNGVSSGPSLPSLPSVLALPDDDSGAGDVDSDDTQVQGQTPLHDDGDMPGHKLSRSARRRRNKRLRRMQGDGAPAAAGAGVAGVVNAGGAAGEKAVRPETRGAVFGAAPVAPVEEAVESEPKTEGRGRRGRGRKKDAERADADGSAAEDSSVVASAVVGASGSTSTSVSVSASAFEENGGESAKRGRGRRGAKGQKDAGGEKNGKLFAKVEAASAPVVDAEPPKPLTAAAFWAAPEPEPEAKPEKKKQGGRKKAASAKGKAKESVSDKSASADPMEKKPLPMDKADEADIPIDWLDEI